jgi:branched-chain amino acid transport system substrate-binding protein
MTTLVSDPAVMAVVGPFNSAVAKVQIPISNAAGLLQCSPANTNPDLTKGDAGKQLRSANPDKINYIRVATTDDIQGPAVAQYAYNDLGLKNVAIIDDLSVYGKGIADAFAAEFTKLGGKVVDREGADPKTTDYSPILTKFAGLNPDSVFFGGVTANGGGLARKQMPQAGLGALPFLGGDGIQDQNGGVQGSFINIAGTAADNSFSSVAAIHDIPSAADFATKYTAEYKADPAAYSASGYACAQIIINALAAAAAKGDITRENVRAAATDPATTFQTVLGPVQFDANGDTSQKIISLYKVDTTAAGGKGDWSFVKQINYGQ